jgi:hypothetical protein
MCNMFNINERKKIRRSKLHDQDRTCMAYALATKRRHAVRMRELRGMTKVMRGRQIILS